jgi:hypothetical protein
MGRKCYVIGNWEHELIELVPILELHHQPAAAMAASGSGSAHFMSSPLSASQSWQAVEPVACWSPLSRPSPPSSPVSAASLPTDALSDLSRANSPMVYEGEHDHDHDYSIASGETSSSEQRGSQLVMPKIDIELPRPERARDENSRRPLRVALVGGTGTFGIPLFYDRQLNAPPNPLSDIALDEQRARLASKLSPSKDKAFADLVLVESPLHVSTHRRKESPDDVNLTPTLCLLLPRV